MAISRQQQQPILSAREQRIIQSRAVLVIAAIISTLTISACQTAPIQASSKVGAVTTTPTVMQTPDLDYEIDDDASANEPYIPSEQDAESHSIIEPIQQTPIPPPDRIIITPARDNNIITPPPVVQPTPPSHNELLERARQNSKQQTRQTASNNSNLPAFRNLMQTGINQLKSGNLTAAEGSFTRAQRLAPKSSAVYYYLSQVALKKNQPRKAEAMARRGLSFSQDSSRRRELWRLVLRSGQLQNNSRVIREAQQALR